MNKKHRPQKHGQFVPIGDIAFDLPGVPVKALSERAPQARHHFTTVDAPGLRRLSELFWGDYYIVDSQRNFAVANDVDPEDLARELEVLHEWERAEGL